MPFIVSNLSTRETVPIKYADKEEEVNQQSNVGCKTCAFAVEEEHIDQYQHECNGK